MTVAAIFTGGVVHPFEQAAPALSGVLAAAGFTPRVSFELDEVMGWLKSTPDALLVIYALRWSMTQHEKYAPMRAQWALQMPQAARDTITHHVSSGGGLLGIHTASICFDDWPQWRDILGGAWQWGQSWHPVLAPVQVELSSQHFLTRGLGSLSLRDEIYSDLNLAPDIEIGGHGEAHQASPPRATGSQPIFWTHHYGQGRVACDLLGHDAASLEHPTHRRLLQRAALWASGHPQQMVEAI